LIKFIVEGEPTAFLHLTQGQVKLMRIPDQKLRPDGLKVKNAIRRYLSYKEKVHAAAWAKHINPEPKAKVYLNVMIYFRNRKHPDPENVRKGIQDAVFRKDNLVAGNVDFGYDAMNPRVEIQIVD